MYFVLSIIYKMVLFSINTYNANVAFLTCSPLELISLYLILLTLLPKNESPFMFNGSSLRMSTVQAQMSR